MTCWRTEPPDGRVWALVMPTGAAHPVPEVMQYEPRTDCWISPFGERVWDCEWHPLPDHPAYRGLRTHAVEGER